MYIDKVESEIQSCAYHLLVLFCDLIQYNIRTITLSTFMNAEHLNLSYGFMDIFICGK